MSSLSRKFKLGQFQASSTYSGGKIWPGNEARRTRHGTYITSQIKVAFDWEIRI